MDDDPLLRASDKEYKQKFDQFQKNKNRMIERGLEKTEEMKRDVKETGQLIN